jgi:hypothetical protein
MTGYAHSIYNVKINKSFSNVFVSQTVVNGWDYVLWISNIICLTEESNSDNVVSAVALRKMSSMTIYRLIASTRGFEFECRHKTVHKILLIYFTNMNCNGLKCN